MREFAPITRHDNGWIQARVPLPFALRWVNAYLLPGESGWTLIDPGLRSPVTEAFWEARLPELGIGWRDVRAIVLTHHHPDHYGLSGWLQERTGAPVYMSETARHYAMRMWGEEERRSPLFSEALVEAFRDHGLPDPLIEGLRGHISGVFGQVLPHPADVRPLPPPGETFRMAGAEWELIGGEGHAPGHIAFYDPARGVALCGDQVLPDITPNIGWMPDSDPDPLGSYLSSLRAMLPLGGVFAYPGHRDPFADLAGRAAALLEHHDRRLLRMLELIEEAGALTAFELCERLFGARLRGNPHNLRFAMAETIAHLVRLELSGAAKRWIGPGPEGRDVVRFSKAAVICGA